MSLVEMGESSDTDPVLAALLEILAVLVLLKIQNLATLE